MKEIELIEQKLKDVRHSQRYESICQLDSELQKVVLEVLPNVWQNHIRLYNSYRNTVPADVQFGIYSDDFFDEEIMDFSENVGKIYNTDIDFYDLTIKSNNHPNTSMRIDSRGMIEVFQSRDSIKFFKSSYSGDVEIKGEFNFYPFRIEYQTSVSKDNVMKPIKVNTLKDTIRKTENNKEVRNYEYQEGMIVNSFEELRELRTQKLMQWARETYANNPEWSSALENCLNEYEIEHQEHKHM